MTPERYQQIGDIFHAALEFDVERRATFLDQACAGDEALRHDVESLIASHEQASDFIKAPALAVAAGLLAEREADEMIGRTAAQYKFLSVLGTGGMGRVYLVEDTRLGRRVALKFLPEYFTNDKNRVHRFHREARAASALNHPNILTVYEVGQMEGAEFIATEYVEGETLRARLTGTPFSLREALDVAVQVAEAIAAAHQAGIVHRDLKPENIMVRRDRYVKVLDFGLAKLTENLASPEAGASNVPTRLAIETNPGVVMGTAEYMSPEQARGLAVDARTDVWSLGVVVYEMVAGKRPFAAATHGDTVVAILEREPAPLLYYARHAPNELERIVAKALTKDLEERYQTVKEMAIDLRRLRRRLEVEAELERSAQPGADSDLTRAGSSGDGPDAVAETVIQPQARVSDDAAVLPTSSAEYVVNAIGRHKWGVALFGVLTLFTLSGLGYGLYRFLTLPSTVPEHFQSTSLTRLTATGRARLAAISPDGKYVVYAEEDNQKQSLLVKQVATGSAVQIVPPANVGYWGLTFSNDSNYVYYVRAERSSGSYNNLYRVAALGGNSTKLLEHVDSAVAFSPDGRRLAFVRDNLRMQETLLVLVNSDGSGEQTLATRKSPDRFASDVATRLSWSPDGKIIALPGANADANEIVAVSVEDGSEKSLTPQRWGYVGQIAWLSDASGLMMMAADEGSYQTAAQLWHLSYPGGEARRITNDLNQYQDVSLTSDSSALVTTQQNRISNIWLAPAADVGRARQITAGTFDTSLAWTPDGRIVYWSNAKGTRDIWIMDSDGSNQKQLTHEGNNGRPRVSPDGSYVVYASSRGGKMNVWRMDIDGSNAKPLTDGKGNGNPHVSPDGRWVVYTSWNSGTGILWKVPIDGGNSVQVSGPTANLPVVSPDGKQVACFYWDEEANPSRGAMILPFDGGPPSKRFNIGPHAGGGFALHWSQDGRSLLYISNFSNIWSQPVDGGKPVQLTDFQGDQIFDFEYSRDGKWLAVARGRVTDDVVLIRHSK